MKINLTLSFIFFVLLFFGNTQNFAQEKSKPREFIIVNLAIKKERFIQEIKIPVSNNPFGDDKFSMREGEFTAGGFATVDCVDCPLTGEYDIFAFAVPANEKSVKAHLQVRFLNQRRCDIEGEEFSVEKGKDLEMKLKCGVTLTAHYVFAPERKETTNE